MSNEFYNQYVDTIMDSLGYKKKLWEAVDDNGDVVDTRLGYSQEVADMEMNPDGKYTVREDKKDNT